MAETNGTLYTKTITAQTNHWTVAEAKLSELRDSRGKAPTTGLRFEALYFVTNLTEADPGYNLPIHDRRCIIKAAREANFKVTTPATEAIDPWPVLVSGRGYHAYDKIAFETTAPAQLTSVNATLKTPDDRAAATQKLYDDGTHGDRVRADGVWSNSDVYSFSSSDPIGLWKVQLDGSSASGETVSTIVRFLVHSAVTAGTSNHPHLFSGQQIARN